MSHRTQPVFRLTPIGPIFALFAGGLFCPPGALAGTTLHVPSQYTTLPAAIDDAQDGDTVMVADGTYTGLGNRDLDFTGKAITVVSENGAAACSIDCQASDIDPHRGFHFHSGETSTSVLDGFTIRNGVMPSGGAVLCESGSAPKIQNCVFSDNTANPVNMFEGGGGMCNIDSSPTVLDCDFVGNQVNVTIEATGGGGMVNLNSSPSVSNCVFMENAVIGPGGINYGSGGMGNVSFSSPIVSNCQFIGNTSTDEGGGMGNAFDSHPQLTGCLFSGNSANEGSGGMLNVVSCSPTLVDCTFVGNETLDAAGYGAAGMLAFSDSSPILIGCNFIQNDSAEDCGAVLVLEFSQPQFINCSFLGNTAVGVGGAIAIDNDSNSVLTNCRFSGNVSGLAGGALWNGDNSDSTLTNCTLAGNVAGGSGGGALRNAVSTAQASLTSCVVWNNSPNEISNAAGAVATVTYSDVRGGYAGVGNINLNPLFVDANGPDNVVGNEDDNLRLSAGSPCIDAGDNAAIPADSADVDGDGDTLEPMPLDLDGLARFANDPATADSGVLDPAHLCLPVVEMGAHEFQGTPYAPADLNCDGLIDGRDIGPLVLALFNPAGYEAAYPTCNVNHADVNCDGLIDELDVEPFVASLLAQ